MKSRPASAPDPASAGEARVGLVCRRCGCRHFFVVYPRPTVNGILRRRECRHCGKRIVTRETMG